jgi:hypothetical protein
MTTDTLSITATQVPDRDRLAFLPTHFPGLFLQVEQVVYDRAGALSERYRGGYWDYVELSNGGGYMRPSDANPWHVISENGHSGDMTSDAFGITCTLSALSHLSFRFEHHRHGAAIAEHFHLLRDFVCDHSEADDIFSAID